MNHQLSPWPDFGPGSIPSLFAEYPLFGERSADEMQRLFPNAFVTDATPSDIEELVTTRTLSVSQKSTGNLLYETTLYFSKSATELWSMYRAKKGNVGANELHIFLENNDGDVLSGQKHYVLIGDELRKNIQDNPKYVKVGRLLSKTSLAGHERSELVDSDDPAQIAQLIASVVNGPSFLEQVGMLGAIVFQFKFGSADASFNAASEGLRGFKRVDADFDPATADAKLGFNPYFFPSVTTDNDGGIREIFGIDVPTVIVAASEKLRKELDARSKSAIAALTVLPLLPERLRAQSVNMVESAVRAIDGLFRNGMLLLNDGIGEAIVFINALACGLVNSFIECIAGLIDLIGLIVGAAGSVFGLGDEMVTEQADELLSVLSKIKFTEVLEALEESISKIWSRLKDWMTEELSAADIGYNIGYFVGLVVEFVLTGGAGTLKSAAAKVVSTSKRFATFVRTFIEKVVVRGKATFQNLIKTLRNGGTAHLVHSARQLEVHLADLLDTPQAAALSPIGSRRVVDGIEPNRGGKVKGGAKNSSTILKANMKKYLHYAKNMKGTKGYQTHHLIPKDPRFLEHEVLKKIGLFMEDARNGVHLPEVHPLNSATTLSKHQGSHKAYSDAILELLDELKPQLNKGDDWLAHQVARIQAGARDALNDGLPLGYKDHGLMDVHDVLSSNPRYRKLKAKQKKARAANEQKLAAERTAAIVRHLRRYIAKYQVDL